MEKLTRADLMMMLNRINELTDKVILLEKAVVNLQNPPKIGRKSAS